MKTAIYINLAIAFIAFMLPGCEKQPKEDTRFPYSEFISEGSYTGDYWPTYGWRTCNPEEAGMDADLLKRVNDEILLLQRLHVDIHNVLIIKNGYIVAGDDRIRFVLDIPLNSAPGEEFNYNTGSSEAHIQRKYIPEFYYGYHWWVKPYEYYTAVGAYGQWIFVIPDYDLVVVFTNDFNEEEYLQVSTPERLLNTYIIPAVKW